MHSGPIGEDVLDMHVLAVAKELKSSPFPN
jgi:hypothetical protein